MTTPPAAEATFTRTSPRLERPADAGWRGVSRALARTTGSDVTLWRVLFVVLTFFNCLGLVLYLVGIAAIPREGEPRSLADRLLHGPNRHLQRSDVLLVALIAIVGAGLFSNGNTLIAVAVVGVLGLLYLRSQDGHARTDAVAPPPSAVATDVYQAPLASQPGVVPVSPRPRSILGRVTLSVAAFVGATLVLLSSLGVSGISVEVVLASLLVVIGIGLVASAWLGRATGLIAVAVVLGLALAASAVARPTLDAGVGERNWHPVASASYHLGVGEGTLDLRDTQRAGDGPVEIKARVDLGHLLVLLPADANVAMDAKAEFGDLLLLGADTNGHLASRHLQVGSGAPQLVLDLSVRMGQVEVRRG